DFRLFPGLFLLPGVLKGARADTALQLRFPRIHRRDGCAGVSVIRFPLANALSADRKSGPATCAVASPLAAHARANIRASSHPMVGTMLAFVARRCFAPGCCHRR